MKTLNAGIQGAKGIKNIKATVGGEAVEIVLLKGATDSQGERWYKSDRLNRLTQINGGRLYGEDTMDAMLKDGSLLDHGWLIPDEELFGMNADYLAQF